MTAIDDKYLQLPGEPILGQPLGPEQPAAAGGTWREYQWGAIFARSGGGVFEVHGDIWLHYQQLGRESGILGFPTTDESDTAERGRYNHFERGSIYWTEAFGAHHLVGPILARYASLGWEHGFGHPTSDPLATRFGVTVSQFARGRVAVDNSGGLAFAWRRHEGALLVVSPGPRFSAEVQPLLEHKRDTGLPAAIYELPALPVGGDPYAAPLMIKQAIAEAVRVLGVRWVMLLGDASVMPVIYRCTTGTGNHWAQSWFTHADHYYANVFQGRTDKGWPLIDSSVATWDANNDSRFSEHHWDNDTATYNPDLVDGAPDVAVGRIPAHTPAQVATYVDKVIRYEQAPPPGDRGLTFVLDADYEGLGMSRRAAEIAEPQRRGMQPRWLVLDLPHGTEPPDGVEAAVPWSLGQALADSSWIFYVGHGGPSGWEVVAAGVPCDREHVRTMKNGPHPVVFAAGCETGRFVRCPPTNGQYRSVTGARTHYVASGGADDNSRTRIEHYLEGNPDPVQVVTGDQNQPARIEPLLPHSFDSEPNETTTVAADWVLNPRGGSIAYFGEAAVAPNNWGCELGGRILRHYEGRGTVLGDMYVRGALDYWQDFRASDPEHVQGAPRIFLTYMHLFGDPSLRLW